MTTINPENPSSDDTVVFEFLTTQNGCCYFSKSIVGSHFYFEEIAYDPLTPIVGPIPVIEYWNVGRLEAGEYQVTQIDLRTGTTTQGFSVSEGLLPFPEPAIPSIGFIGAIILAIGLLWIANKALKTGAQKRAA